MKNGGDAIKFQDLPESAKRAVRKATMDNGASLDANPSANHFEMEFKLPDRTPRTTQGIFLFTLISRHSIRSSDTMGEAGRKRRSKKILETMGVEGRLARGKKIANTLGHDGCRDRSLKGHEELDERGVSVTSAKAALTLARNRLKMAGVPAEEVNEMTPYKLEPPCASPKCDRDRVRPLFPFFFPSFPSLFTDSTLTPFDNSTTSLREAKVSMRDVEEDMQSVQTKNSDYFVGSSSFPI
jgi:hypothetical protein